MHKVCILPFDSDPNIPWKCMFGEVSLRGPTGLCVFEGKMDGPMYVEIQKAPSNLLLMKSIQIPIFSCRTTTPSTHQEWLVSSFMKMKSIGGRCQQDPLTATRLRTFGTIWKSTCARSEAKRKQTAIWWYSFILENCGLAKVHQGHSPTSSCHPLGFWTWRNCHWILSTLIFTSYSCNHTCKQIRTCTHVSTLVTYTCACICVLVCLFTYVYCIPILKEVFQLTQSYIWNRLRK